MIACVAAGIGRVNKWRTADCAATRFVDIICIFELENGKKKQERQPDL